MTHEQFYIVEEEEGRRKALLSTVPRAPGSTYTHSIHPQAPGTTCTVIAGPFDLPEPMPHVLAVERWMRFERPNLYAEHFDVEDEWVTEQVNGQILCERCGDWFEPVVSDVSDAEFGDLSYFQHTDRLCSENCVHDHVFAYRE